MAGFVFPITIILFPLSSNDLLGGDYTWSGTGDIVSDGKDLLACLPPGPTGLIGYSYGGLVAWWISLVAPHRGELIILGSIPLLVISTAFEMDVSCHSSVHDALVAR